MTFSCSFSACTCCAATSLATPRLAAPGTRAEPRPPRNAVTDDYQETTVTAISLTRSHSPARRLLQADTYRRTAPLIADPVLGVITFTATATLLTLAAG